MPGLVPGTYVFQCATKQARAVKFLDYPGHDAPGVIGTCSRSILSNMPALANGARAWPAASPFAGGRSSVAVIGPPQPASNFQRPPEPTSAQDHVYSVPDCRPASRGGNRIDRHGGGDWNKGVPGTRPSVARLRPARPPCLCRRGLRAIAGEPSPMEEELAFDPATTGNRTSQAFLPNQGHRRARRD